MGSRRGESSADIVDKIFSQVDPVVAAGGLLCAASASLGITPPLTALVSSLTDRAVQSNIMDALTWSPVSQKIGLMTGQTGIVSWADILSGNYGEVSVSEADKVRRHHGVVLMGAFEGLLLMTLAQNEAALGKVMELGGKLGAATITAAGEAVPF